MEENKQQLTVTIEVKEVMYDVMNKAYLTGQAREAGGTGYESASYMQASEDGENSYQLRRSVANAYSALKTTLGEYLDEKHTSADNKIAEAVDNDGQLTLAFKLPSNYNSAAADSLADGIHAFLVDTALAEWFTITNKGDAQDYVDHAAASAETCKRALYKRVRPSRPQYS